MLSSSLAAGYSMENSFAQAQAQLEEMYGERGMMSKEFAVMRSQLSMNRTLEELWGDFAKRSGIEEIRSFAQIFKAARRSGGQLGMIISHVSEIIGGKIQVQEEIRLMTAQKQFEQKIMNLLPLLKMSTLNSTFFHVFIVLPFCTIRSLFYCIFSLLGSAIVRLPLLPASHAPYFRSYASCFTSSSNSSPAE